MKKLTIITDSLGMPRNDMPIEKVWTSMLLDSWSKKLKIYFYPTRALHTGLVANDRFDDLILMQKSDITILQIGIVDCCRRPTTRRTQMMLITLEKILRLMGLHKIISINRFYLTKIHDYKLVSEHEFEQNIEKIVKGIREYCQNATILWIEIGEPCNELVEKIYNVREDSKTYNEILNRLGEKFNFNIIKPYSNNEQLGKANFFVEDGHHLSELGHKIVYNEINKVLEEKLGV